MPATTTRIITKRVEVLSPAGEPPVVHTFFSNARDLFAAVVWHPGGRGC
jgi:hypothetical protein